MVPAIMFLCGIVYKQLPPAVLASRCDKISSILLKTLTNHSEDAVATRWALECAGITLVAVPVSILAGKGASAARGVLGLYRALVVFSTDLRPRVRKTAQAAVAAVLSGLKEKSGARIPQSVLRATSGTLVQELDACTAKDCQGANFACGLLQQVVGSLPATTSRGILDKLFSLATRGTPILLIQAMRTAEALFASLDPADAESSSAAFPPAAPSKRLQLAADMLDTVQTLRPHLADIDASLAYLRAVTSGLTALARGPEPKMAAERLPSSITALAASLVSPRAPVVSATAAALRSTLRGCLRQQRVVGALSANNGAGANALADAFDALLGFKYKTAWKHSFSAAAEALRWIDMRAHPQARRILLALDSLRQGTLSDAEKLSLEAAVEAVVTASGPEGLLDALPLELPTADCNTIKGGGSLSAAIERARTWILPLLRDTVRTAKHPLAIYFQKIYPQIPKLEAAARALPKIGKDAEAKRIAAVAASAWECLPSFCLLPSDADTALARMAPAVASLIGKRSADENKTARDALCRGMSALLNSVRVLREALQREASGDVAGEDAVDVDGEGGQDEKAATAQESPSEKAKRYGLDAKQLDAVTATASELSKKFLPVLFSSAMKTAEGEDATPVVEAISAFAQVAPVTRVLSPLFRKLLKRMLTTQTRRPDDPELLSRAVHEAALMADITGALVTSLDDASLKWVLKAFLPMLKDKDANMQKKAYKVVRLVCETSGNFFSANYKQVTAAVADALSEARAGVARFRLHCLERLVPALIRGLDVHPDGFSALGAFVGEVILSCKEQNTKARASAFGLSVGIGRLLRDSRVDPSTLPLLAPAVEGCQYPLLNEYIQMVSGGLASATPRMQGATVSVLARLIYEFRQDIPGETTERLLRAVCLLLQENSREVVKAVLGFAKVAVLAIDPSITRRFLPELTQGLCRWADDRKNRFRQKTRAVFVALANRYGVEALETLVPDKHRALVTHIRKEAARKAREKAERWGARCESAKAKRAVRGGLDVDSDDEDDNDDDDSESSSSDGEGAGAAGAQRRAGKDDMVIVDSNVDFLSSSAMQNVVRGDAAGISSALNRKRDDEVKVDAEGKMVFDFGLEGEKDEANGSDGSGDDMGDGKAATQASRSRRRGAKRGRERGGGDTGGTRRIHSGKRFKAKRGTGGDVKRKGQNMDPYAYVPMNPAHLNKRKIHKARKAFETVVKRAKQGALKGAKLRKRDGSRRLKGRR